METQKGVSTEEAGNAVSVTFQHDRLSSLLLRFLNGLKRTGKSTHTLSAYRTDLTLFSKFLIEKQWAPSDWSVNLQEEWIHFLSENGRHSQASQRRALMSVRTFLHFLVKEGIISGSPLLEVKSPRQPNHDLLTILPEHFQRLVTTLKLKANLGDEKAVRDLCLVLVLGECGLKASEAANLCWGDIHINQATPENPASGSLLIRGSNERVLSFGTTLSDALILLKEIRTSLTLPVEPGSKLFFGYLNLTRRTRTPSLHRHGIKFVVYEVCNEILAVPYNSESLRNHAIVAWMNQGLTPQRVADLAGYSSLNSLERFSLETRGLRKPRRQMKADAHE